MSVLTFIDLETPNLKNNSLCSIGIITRREGGEETSEHHFVNPEDRFDEFNIQLHGISPDMVRDAPSFAEFWEKRLAAVFEEDPIIVGHNVTFDLRVIADSFRRSFGRPLPDVRYICTLALARKLEQNIPNHKLPTCCRAHGISLGNHHNALADITATAALFDCYEPWITDDDISIFRPQ